MSKDHNVKKSRSSFGWGRLEAVGSLCTLVFLGSLSFGTTIEALQVSSEKWQSFGGNCIFQTFFLTYTCRPSPTLATWI